ncbi:MAG: hypothetical protein EB141_01110 [Verrucomicrobia bacterium]|nr:hypothetical protein [Verrucomicrobiota bacterium]NBU07845.1 hypothetical protein [Pseudomonadota bacterium]NDA65433.1 hypothetical protein [Verrucomicrobiota bacterium]NDB74243.1 hypothetical protein [Verrucomicrobiota bacterium]NDD38143.1 hypothetical protein [Verrucomicrobiota bacterium]
MSRSFSRLHLVGPCKGKGGFQPVILTEHAEALGVALSLVESTFEQRFTSRSSAAGERRQPPLDDGGQVAFEQLVLSADEGLRAAGVALASGPSDQLAVRALVRVRYNGSGPESPPRNDEDFLL